MGQQQGVNGGAQRKSEIAFPKKLDNKLLFWDFRNPSSYAETGGKITKLIDLYGVTADTDFQATGAATGLTISGDNLVLPGDSNQYFINQESASYWDFMHNGSDWSVFLSFTSLQGNSAGVFFTNIDFGSAIGLDFFLDNRTSLSRSQQFRYRVRNASTNIVNNGLNGAFTASTEAKVASNYDYSNLSIDVYKNSSTLLGSIASSSGATASSATNQLVFFGTGTTPASVGNFIEGKLKGLVITKDLLTTQEITKLKAFFS